MCLDVYKGWEMLHNVTKATKIALNFHKSQNFFFSKEFLIDKEAGRAYSSFSRRDVAQSGSALEWGSRGRRFKSFHPDQHIKENYPKGTYESRFPFLIPGSGNAGYKKGILHWADSLFGIC